MPNLMNYIWIVLLAIYIISPLDAVPHIFDDILASIALFYFLYKSSRQKQFRQQFYDHSQRSHSGSYTPAGAGGPLTLEEAYKVLGVGPEATMDEINRAYKEKMRMSHPDKVNHLSEELQEKAKEITLELNEAYDLIKRYKK